jgi:hypothetical protein
VVGGNVTGAFVGLSVGESDGHVPQCPGQVSAVEALHWPT